MTMKIRELYKKYSETTFRMALDHLFDIGIVNFSKRSEQDIENICRKSLSETPNNSLISGKARADIIRCAYELSKFSVWDILKFVQTDLKIDGATVHPGIIIRFLNNESGAEIKTVVVPSETTTEQIDTAIAIVEDRAEIHRKNGIFSSFSARYEIQNAFNSVKVRTSEMFKPEHDVYL